MRDRSTASARARRSAAISIDIVLCAPRGRHLAVLLVRAGAHQHGRWSLPRAPFAAGVGFDETATATATTALGRPPGWLAQVATVEGAIRHPATVAVTVGYVGVVDEGAEALTEGAQWFTIAELPALAQAHRTLITVALSALRERMDSAPIAFRMLPSAFSLAELQAVYELLLGRRLHKASFRRTLHAALVVASTGEWRREGPGRPAQLFRFSPRRRKAGRHGVRFEMLGG